MNEDEVRAVVKETVRETVKETLPKFGIDTDKPTDMQADMAHLRRHRIASEAMGTRFRFVLIGVLVVGMLGTALLGIKSIFGPQ